MEQEFKIKLLNDLKSEKSNLEKLISENEKILDANMELLKNQGFNEPNFDNKVFCVKIRNDRLELELVIKLIERIKFNLNYVG